MCVKLFANKIIIAYLNALFGTNGHFKHYFEFKKMHDRIIINFG